MHVQIGILTVTASVAKSVADAMIDGGIRAIWNFTPTSLDVPEHVILQREELASSLPSSHIPGSWKPVARISGARLFPNHVVSRPDLKLSLISSVSLMA
jgi:hypothetical protein